MPKSTSRTPVFGASEGPSTVPGPEKSPAPEALRPSWFSGAPTVEFDCRRTAGRAPALREMLQAAEGIPPGRLLAVRADRETVLLSRSLAKRGFTHWSEEDGEGGRRNLFLRITW